MVHQLAAFSIRPFRADEWPAYRALRLRALADAPDAFSTMLDTQQELPPETWAARLSAAAASGKDCPLVAELHGERVGMAWTKVDADDPAIVNLFQMWVAPEARGQGVAAALLAEAVRWSGARGAQALQLGVNCANLPAVRLYERAGFVETGLREPFRPGAAMTEQRMRLELAPALPRI